MPLVERASDGGASPALVAACETLGVLIHGETERRATERADEDDASEARETAKEGASDVEDGEAEKFARALSAKPRGEVLEALTGHAETLFGDGGDKEVSGVVAVMANLAGDDGGR